MDWDEIFCYDCLARIPIESYYLEQPLELSQSERWENARKEAIEAWNRRTERNNGNEN